MDWNFCLPKSLIYLLLNISLFYADNLLISYSPGPGVTYSLLFDFDLRVVELKGAHWIFFYDSNLKLYWAEYNEDLPGPGELFNLDLGLSRAKKDINTVKCITIKIKQNSN